jgi:hypothetical protein
VTRAVFVVSVPIVDATGREVERRLVCAAMDAASVGQVRAVVRADEFHAWLVGRFGARLRRLRAWARLRSATGATVDSALAAQFADPGAAGAQPGLFGGAERIECRSLPDHRPRDWEGESVIEVGRPSLELIVWPRPWDG